MIQIKTISYKSTWDIRKQVMWPNKPIDYIKILEDKNGLHYGLELNNKLISVISLFINNEEAQFRKFATLTNEHGKGYGTKLLTQLMEDVKLMNINKIWCNARLEKIKFYKKFGMQQTDNYFSKEEIDYIIMEKKLNITI